MQIDKINVGRKIKDIRQRNGYSMEQFGKQIDNAPRGSVNSWEKGVNLPSQKRLELIALMGNTDVNELLYGSIEDYVEELLANSLRIRAAKPFIEIITQHMKLFGYSYGDDIQILQMVNNFMSGNGVVEKSVNVIYEPISEMDHLYIGKVDRGGELQCSYYIYSDTVRNVMHVLPFFMNKKGMDFYRYPSILTQKGEHGYFSDNFSSANIVLGSAMIMYYGINEEKSEAEITLFEYKYKLDRFELDEEPLPKSYIKDEFYREIKKEALYLQMATENV